MYRHSTSPQAPSSSPHYWGVGGAVSGRARSLPPGLGGRGGEPTLPYRRELGGDPLHVRQLGKRPAPVPPTRAGAPPPRGTAPPLAVEHHPVHVAAAGPAAPL